MLRPTLLRFTSLLACVASTASAATCRDGEETAARVREVQRTLQRERNRWNVWAASWGGGNGALAVGQAIALPFVVDRGLRTDLAVGAISNAVGAGFALIQPLGFPGETRIARAPGGARACTTLALAEHLLAEGTAFETASRGWLAHLGNLAFNMAVWLALGLGFGRWESGAISGSVGMGVGVAQVLTQPNGLAAPHDAPIHVAPIVTHDFAGVGLAIAF